MLPGTFVRSWLGLCSNGQYQSQQQLYECGTIPSAVHTERQPLEDGFHEPGNAPIQIQKKPIGPIWIGSIR